MKTNQLHNNFSSHKKYTHIITNKNRILYALIQKKERNLQLENIVVTTISFLLLPCINRLYFYKQNARGYFLVWDLEIKILNINGIYSSANSRFFTRRNYRQP